MIEKNWKSKVLYILGLERNNNRKKLQQTVSYVKIKIQRVASHDDLKKWEDRMLEKAKCWNKFCLGVCDDHELRAVYVVKEDNEENIYLTTLCEDCIKETADYGLLVNEKHLILDHHK